MYENLTKQEAARLLKISVRKIDYLRQSGELACIKIGRLVRFRPQDVEEFLIKQRVPVTEKKNP